jgi:F-type H+-transporting ATPase subunit gamma
MTKRRDLEHHRDSLDEIGEILSSMKTLAYMETQKLSRFLAAQQKVVESIDDVAADFLGFFPEVPSAIREATPVYLVIGSERGFCGDFNRALARRLVDERSESEVDSTRAVVVGHKLHSLLEDDESVAAFIDGASVVEEVPLVLQRLVAELNKLQASVSSVRLIGIHHDGDGISVRSLLPPFQGDPSEEVSHAFAPLLNIPAIDFLGELVDHYLFSTLNTMLYASLMCENQRRVAHLGGAVRRLEEESGELTRRCRALRQEEIVEEIEVILLSATGPDFEAG